MPGNKGGNGKPGGGGEEVPLYLSGNKKDNVLTGGTLGDWINGKEGNDTLHGGDGNDELLGADGDDILYGDAGNDELGGGDGDDELYGGDGNDVLHGGMGADVMDGGENSDLSDDHDIASFVEVHNLDPVTGWPSDIGLVIQAYTNADNLFDYVTDHGDLIGRVEEIQGTNYNDIMFGRNDMDDYFVGARGNDVIIGGNGGDTLYGSLDDDVIYVGRYNGSVANIQDGMLDASKSIADTDPDLLIFLRYTSDYDGDGNPEEVLGDGHDIIYGFDLNNDSILFLNTETDANGDPDEVFDVLAGLVEVGSGNAQINYAEDSWIILDGISVDDLKAADLARPVDGANALFNFEYVDA